MLNLTYLIKIKPEMIFSYGYSYLIYCIFTYSNK
jgi:hypothetical protein